MNNQLNQINQAQSHVFGQFVPEVAPRKVWIVALDRGPEGMSEPLEAFESAKLADIFKRGAEAAFGTAVKVFELTVQR